MKTLIITLLLTLPGMMNSQTEENPKEFTISLSKDVLELDRGANAQVDVNLLKAKGYQKGNVKFGLSSSLPPGVTLFFDPANGVIENAKATITVANDAAPGTYSLVVNATISYKTKGTILKLIVK